MKIYLVGGAVRDELLNLPVKERDWVVVGSSIHEMIKKGFKPVGKDFPVFLHPKTHEEYALARTERKTSKGYKGFEFYTGKNVSLEDDLRRRDLTINAMAKDENGSLIDPFNGKKDLKNHVLRHVSDAFAEDPVRILRVARFASKFSNFKIAPKTNQLMKQMVTSGEIDALVPERIWQELNRALQEFSSERFIEVLQNCGALKIIFPEIDTLFGIPEPEKWHPEKDTGIHTLLALKKAAQSADDPMIKFAVLVHDFGKAKTPKTLWPRHHKHDINGIDIVKSFCQRIRAPKKYQDLALLVTKYHLVFHKILELTPQKLLKLLLVLDPFRRPKRFEQFIIACEADENGRLSLSNKGGNQGNFLKRAFESCKQIDIEKIISQKKEIPIEKMIFQERLKLIKKIIPPNPK